MTSCILSHINKNKYVVIKDIKDVCVQFDRVNQHAPYQELHCLDLCESPLNTLKVKTLRH